MNVELTMQNMFEKFPALFKERADCLNQFFCVIGNGFVWENGELVDHTIESDNIEFLASQLVEKKAFQHNKLSLRGEAIYYALQNKKKKGQIIPKNVMDAFDRWDREYFETLSDDEYYTKSRHDRWYFYNKFGTHECISFYEPFAYLFNYPDNIKPDWLAAINECRELLTEDGYNLPERRNVC